MASKVYTSMPDENKGSLSNRPEKDPPTPAHLIMSPENEAALIEHDFRRNKHPFRLRNRLLVEAGEGWYRFDRARGLQFYTNCMALVELKRMRGASK